MKKLWHREVSSSLGSDPMSGSHIAVSPKRDGEEGSGEGAFPGRGWLILGRREEGLRLPQVSRELPSRPRRKQPGVQEQRT